MVLQALWGGGRERGVERVGGLGVGGGVAWRREQELRLKGVGKPAEMQILCCLQDRVEEGGGGGRKTGVERCCSSVGAVLGRGGAWVVLLAPFLPLPLILSSAFWVCPVRWDQGFPSGLGWLRQR